MRGTRLKYLRNGFTLLEMTEELDKRHIYVLNDVYMWEMVYVCGEWFMGLRNG